MRRALASVRDMRLAWMIPAAFLLVTGSARAQELYGCDNSGQLFLINTITGTGTAVCTLPVFPDPGATEIEYDDIAQLAFVQARDGAFQGQLFDIPSCSASGALVATGDLVFNGLEFIDGVLYGAGIPNTCSPSVLAVVDPVTGAPVVIGATGLGPVSGLAWDPSTQMLYGVTGCSQSSDAQLVTIDTATGAATVIGPTGRSLGSLEFGADGLLYGAGDNRDGGNLYIVNPLTAATIPVGPTGFANVTGLALVNRPVPVLASRFDAAPGHDGVHLSWELSADEPVLGFRIYRRGAGGAPRTVADRVGPGERSYTDRNVAGGVEYEYTLGILLADGEIVSQTARVRAHAIGVALHQNTPNPFNPGTRIAFDTDRHARATLVIYDARGHHVRTLVDEIVGEGRHEYFWDGKNANGTSVGSGVYFYRFASNKQTLTKKMVLMK